VANRIRGRTRVPAWLRWGQALWRRAKTSTGETTGKHSATPAPCWKEGPSRKGQEGSRCTALSSACTTFTRSPLLLLPAAASLSYYTATLFPHLNRSGLGENVRELNNKPRSGTAHSPAARACRVARRACCYLPACLLALHLCHSTTTRLTCLTTAILIIAHCATACFCLPPPT